MSITLNNQPALTRDEDPGRLISELYAWGIEYLVGESHLINTKERMPAVELVKRLAQCEYPRVRDASISLFLLHPELADAVLEAYQTSEPVVSEQIAVVILAALYLQRLWSFRLAIALGHTPGFPEQPFTHLWQSRQLPSPACQHGKRGLVALQAAEQHRRALPLNFIGDWQNQIDHLLDLIDVKLLMQQKVISLEELDVAYQEVLPRMGKRPYINLDPQKFADRYAIVRQELQQLA